MNINEAKNVQNTQNKVEYLVSIIEWRDFYLMIVIII